MVGKLAVSTAYQIMVFYSSELFPTEVRSRGIGTCFMVARIGSIASPFITDILVSISTFFFLKLNSFYLFNILFIYIFSIKHFNFHTSPLC